MKKVVLFSSVVLLIGLLTGCSNATLNETERKNSENELDTGTTKEMLQGSELSSIEEVVPPGTLPNPDEIQQPNQSIVGNKGIYSLHEYKELAFAYYYNKDTTEERLILVEYPNSIDKTTTQLMVLETDFGGWEGLKRNLTSTFEATVLAYKNITFEEGNYAYNVSLPGSGMKEYYNEGEIVDLHKQFDNLSTVQYYWGSTYDSYPNNPQDAVINELSSGKYVSILSNAGKTESEQLSTKKEIYNRIFERYNLKEIVSVE